MRARHRLSKFLLRRGLRFPGCAWTQPHERWLRSLSFDDALSRATFIDYCCAVEALVAAPRGADRGARAGRAGQQPRPGDRAVALFPRDRHALSGRVCAPRSAASSGSPSPTCCRGSSASCRSEYTSTASACRARSPRPARRTRAGCSSRPPTTTVAAPRSARASPPAKPARTRASSRSPGARSVACTHAGRTSRAERGKPTGTVAVACARELAAFCWEAATLN